MILNTDLKIAVISDIHLFHRRTPTSEIIDNMNRCLVNDQVFGELDILFLAGDVFDDLNHFGDEEIAMAQFWIAKIITLAVKHSVKVRVLEGTPSHDRKQSQSFETIRDILAQRNDCEIDLKYFTTLDIEIMADSGLKVLYVPDEWRNEASITYNETISLLKSKGIDNVDIAIMHGMFDFQCPEVTKTAMKHSTSDYMGIVKGPVFVGHVHQFSSNERVFAQGSFDRLAHGEEHDKGYIQCKLYKDLQFEVEFIVNKDAKVYKTIRCTGSDSEEDLKKIDKAVKSLKEGSYIRIETKPNTAITQSLAVLRTTYPTYNWDLLIKEKLKDKPKLLVDDNVYEAIIINKGTLPQLLAQELKLLNVTDEEAKNIVELTMLEG